MRPISLVLTIADGKGSENQMLLNVTNTSNSTDVSAQMEVARQAQVLVDSLISGRIVRCGLILDVELDVSIKTTPDVNSDVEEAAVFVWGSENGHNTQSRIPTFREDKLITSTRLVDLTDIDVIAFNDSVIDGIEPTPGTLIEFQDNRGDDITLLMKAREVIGASRL